MTEDQLNAIMRLINDIMFIDSDEVVHLENWLYGMFDGYLYEEIPHVASRVLPEDLAERVIDMWNLVNSYPKL
jgi:hypothetical protein